MFNIIVYYLFIKYPAFEGQFNEVSRNDKNNIFREFECGLTVEEAAKFCLKSVSINKVRVTVIKSTIGKIMIMVIYFYH